jgi:Ni/Co efflux regulator RcnB
MRKLLAVALVAIVMGAGTVVPAHAQDRSGGRHDGRGDDRHGDHDRDRDRDRGHDRDRGWPHFRGPVVTYWPTETYAVPPSYWYYCPSAGTYYPYVTSCWDPWVPVLAR